MRHAEFIYKIASPEVAAASRRAGTLTGMAVDLADGFVHFSTAEQLPETLRLHFRGQAGLVLMAVRAADLGDALTWEPSRGGALFPHLYGTMPMAAVVRASIISVDSDGRCSLPEWVQ
jgi:uncharacterized protein (DUF952 family)